MIQIIASKREYCIYLRKILAALLLMVWLPLLSEAQDPEFSQFYANPIYLNPALTGTSLSGRLISNYRNQWPRQGNTFVTYHVSYDQYLPEIKSGVGLQMTYDRELNGVINTITTSFLYSYPIRISDPFVVSFATEIGFLFKQFNVENLIFPGMIDQGTGQINGGYPLPSENGQKIIPDLSFGFAGQYNSVYFGLAMHHLNQPDMSIIEGDQIGRLPMKLTLHAGAKGFSFYRGLLSREFHISPNLLYRQQGGFKQVNAGMYYNEELLTLGMWYRNNLSARPNSLIAMIGLSKPKFQLGYSFDVPLSEITAYSYGSHELSLIFFFGQGSRRLFHRAMMIPNI